jgi:hypothetical protein
MIDEIDCFFCDMPITMGETAYEHEGHFSHQYCYERELVDYQDMSVEPEYMEGEGDDE